ncbi:MAG: PAS domain S-box protein [Spirochaetes bacterium]|nr:PAS domain S-box protein [Spirochaetota bacterium]
MNDEKLTKQQLIGELNKLRRKLKKFEHSEADLKETEYALRKSEFLYAALFENNPIQTVVVDHKGCVIAYNRQKKISGDRLPDVGDIMYKDYASRHDNDMYSELINCIQSGEMREFPEQKYGGKVLNIKIAPIKNGAIITSIDITERKKAEQELLKITKAVENTSEAVGIFDSSGSNYYQNKSFNKLFGYSIKELSSYRGAPPYYKDQETAADIFKSVMKGVSWTGELEAVSKSGRDFTVQLIADAIRDDKSEIIGLVCVHTDITEQKRFEEENRNFQAQVLHAQKLESLGVLAGSIAHDFNNLLLGILGNADLAMLDMPSSSPAKQYLNDIVIIARRAAELCKQMLAYSGKGKFIIEPLNLSGLVEEIGHLLEISISKNIEIEYNLSDAIPYFNADATQLRQVIMNLITNASDAIGDDEGKISVTTGLMKCDSRFLKDVYCKDRLAEGEYIFIDVTDTGCGMDKDTMDNIFDPFFSTKISGRGLGLAAVLGIIRSHGGGCKVISKPGRGTSFRILFPLSETGRDVQPYNAEAGFSESRIGYRKVLLIDSDETACSEASAVLEETGFGVVTACDSDQALEQLYKHGHDIKLVIVDLDMPGMNARSNMDLIKQIKDNIPVIVSSTYREEEIYRVFRKESLAGYLHKPYEAAFLREVIFGALAYKLRT